MKKRLRILLGFGLFLLASCGNEVNTNTTKSKESTTETTSIQSTTDDESILYAISKFDDAKYAIYTKSIYESTTNIGTKNKII